MRVLMVLVDGMRPDAIADLPEVKKIMEKSAYTMHAASVVPPVTLPCHMSIFHSIDPKRHGIMTNTYVPQARPVKGLCEVLLEHKKKNAFFYSWGELRDITEPKSLTFSYFCKGRDIGYEKANDILTDEAIKYLSANDTDFAFLYLGYTDMAGHTDGWMSEPYMDAIHNSWKNIEHILEELSENYTVIITADHGGHDRTHGEQIPEDMTIPFFIMGKDFEAGSELQNVSLKDIAPTVAALLGVEPDEEWEGKKLL